MTVPTTKYTLRGLTLPHELTSLGIVGFCVLHNRVFVTTADNCLTAEQVKALAIWLQNCPNEETRGWAINFFNTDDQTIAALLEISQYMSIKIDLRTLIDPFNLIHQDEQADPIR